MSGAAWMLVLLLSTPNRSFEAEDTAFRTWAECREAAQVLEARLLMEWEATQPAGRPFFLDVKAYCRPIYREEQDAKR